MDYQQLYKPCDWLTASVVMVFIPTDGHGYRGNGSRISVGQHHREEYAKYTGNISTSSLLCNLVGHREIRSVNAALQKQQGRLRFIKAACKVRKTFYTS